MKIVKIVKFVVICEIYKICGRNSPYHSAFIWPWGGHLGPTALGHLVSADMPPKRLSGSKCDALGRRDTNNTVAIILWPAGIVWAPQDAYPN